MEAAKKTNDVMTSAAAFVEGGVQEACDDACSICLEDFSQCDPSSVTNCKHEFHLQCILEWCQRSSNCPMCWQPISLKDETSQQLLEAVEEERNLTSDRLRNVAMFHHPSVMDFDIRQMLQLPNDASQVVLEDHIFQQLAAAAAERRGHHIFRREGQENWSSSQRRHPFFIFSAPNARSENTVWSSIDQNSVGDQVPTVSLSSPQTYQASVLRVGSNDQQLISGFASRSSERSSELEEQSEEQSFTESLRSRLSTWSMRYRDSFSRNTRQWKERLFSRSTSMADVGTDVPREVHAGFANVSHLMDRLDVRDNAGYVHATGTSNSSSRRNMNNLENHPIQTRDNKVSVVCPANSASD